MRVRDGAWGWRWVAAGCGCDVERDRRRRRHRGERSANILVFNGINYNSLAAAHCPIPIGQADISDVAF